MKRFVLFAILIFLFLGCASAPVKSGPAEPETWDFGRVKEGLVLKHDFVIRNTSKETLNIQKVHTSCGCTTSGVKKKTILPGEKTFIEVQFNSKGYSGPVQQHIYVNTDSLDNPILKFIIKAEVVKEAR
ncbi:MAG: hypothetical protein A2984_03450 [Omnitrophica WOR_2 bacterium RIFCSPLOWO2_01_FULL_41_12]|nr:MAG: hypothetical protein A2984_03450 [Omnitrophica WOR_2 bacterium RIFCSPLOWO2_01_FULL_41_12]